MDIGPDINTIIIDSGNVVVVNQGGAPSVTSLNQDLEKYIQINKQGNVLYLKIDSTYNDNKPTTYFMKLNVSNSPICNVVLLYGQLNAGAICSTSTNYTVHNGILVVNIPPKYYTSLNISVDEGVIDIREYIMASNGAKLKKYPELGKPGKHEFVLNGDQKAGGNVWSVHADKGLISIRGND